MEDGEATVLGLRRSKPLFFFFLFFFSLGGSFSYSKQPHKRLPVSLATSPSDLGPFISLPSLSMTCPHQGSYKISPFPMKHQQTFWRVWLSPRWISGVSTPPPHTLTPSFPPSFPPPLLSSANTTPLLGEPQILNISCDGQRSRKHRARRGESHWGGRNVR